MENTSHIIDEEDAAIYKKKLLKHSVIIDTAHLFSSGLAETTDQMLSIIRRIHKDKRLFGLHLND